MSDPKRFYYSHLPRCDIHRDKTAGYEVKNRGERYRYACTEACAKRQCAELEKAWAK